MCVSQLLSQSQLPPDSPVYISTYSNDLMAGCFPLRAIKSLYFFNFYCGFSPNLRQHETHTTPLAQFDKSILAEWAGVLWNCHDCFVSYAHMDCQIQPLAVLLKVLIRGCKPAPCICEVDTYVTTCSCV